MNADGYPLTPLISRPLTRGNPGIGMSDLTFYQYGLVGIIFVWSGFVRSGLGFGGAVLSLPFLLLVVDQPLVFLPLIAAAAKAQHLMPHGVT